MTDTDWLNALYITAIIAGIIMMIKLVSMMTVQR